MRTTIDIDGSVLAEFKVLGQREGKSLGRLVSDLLAAALAGRRQGLEPVAKPIHWVAKPMQARVDLADRDAVFDAINGPRRFCGR